MPDRTPAPSGDPRLILVRLRVFDGTREAAEDARHVTAVDFRTDTATEYTLRRLNDRLRQIAAADAPHRALERWRMEVYTYWTGELLFTWTYQEWTP